VAVVIALAAGAGAVVKYAVVVEIVDKEQGLVDVGAAVDVLPAGLPGGVFLAVLVELPFLDATPASSNIQCDRAAVKKFPGGPTRPS
jgi:hypothetical protein